ncbi:hypothetical protein RRF57_009621 [Xylaria bambusicola]|uniref:Uncharacterized protein n=1 Tax=Xylaria bambusicola TaxID=326684 RepID=A0AAN7Z934_9PEZI
MGRQKRANERTNERTNEFMDERTGMGRADQDNHVAFASSCCDPASNADRAETLDPLYTPCVLTLSRLEHRLYQTRLACPGAVSLLVRPIYPAIALHVPRQDSIRGSAA